MSEKQAHTAAPTGGPIVVGVDASEPSKSALRWAFRQAEMTGAPLRVVMSWDLPATAYWAVIPEGLNFEADTRKVLDETVNEVLGPDPGVDVTAVVTEGRPAAALIDESKGASLLVVGSRGHGAFAGMLLGSVSEHCVSHAHCPVVVVREPVPAPR